MTLHKEHSLGFRLEFTISCQPRCQAPSFYQRGGGDPLTNVFGAPGTPFLEVCFPFCSVSSSWCCVFHLSGFPRDVSLCKSPRSILPTLSPVTGSSSFAAHSKEPFQDKENSSPHLEPLPPILEALQSVQPTLQTFPYLSCFLTTKQANQCCSDFSWQQKSRLGKMSIKFEPKNEEAQGFVSRRGIFLHCQ